MIINNNLKKYRKEKRITQKELANSFKISVRQLQNLESKTPKAVIQFCEFANFFEIPIDDLLKQDNTELLSPASKNSSEIHK